MSLWEIDLPVLKNKMERIMHALNNLSNVAAARITYIATREKQFMMMAADMIFSPGLAIGFQI